MITIHVDAQQLNELQELVKEKLEQVENLVNHYEHNLNVLKTLGKDPEAQRLNYEAALAENKNRLQLYKVLKNQIAV
jgi:hypothetical protein